ncbi:MAG: MFS transporter [Candidatus Lokiarchaeota archaeon]|nr:MFS transporter [Candidatus Lokiarchaeota archaeon]
MSKIDALAKNKEEEQDSNLRSGRYQWFIVVFMGLVGMVDNNLNLMENVAIPYILDEFSMEATEFALIQALFGIVTFAVFFLAWFFDAFGRKKGVLVLMLVMGIPALLIVFLSQNVFLFFIWYSIVITATLSNTWEVVVSEESPAKKRGLYGGIATLVSLLPLYAILGVRIADGLGWRWTYGIFGIIVLVLLIPWCKLKETQRWTDNHAKRDHEKLKIKKAIKSLNKKDWTYILICTLVYGLWTISFKLGSSWGGYYYLSVRTEYAAQWSTILLIGGLLILVGALTSGVIMDKISRKVTLIVGCVGSVLSFTFLGLTGSPIAFWCAYFFFPIVFTWIMVYFSEVFRTEIRSTAIGIAATGVRISYVLGPLLASALLATFPTMEMFWIIGGLFMIIPLFSLLLKPYETKGKTLEEIQEER